MSTSRGEAPLATHLEAGRYRGDTLIVHPADELPATLIGQAV